MAQDRRATKNETAVCGTVILFMLVAAEGQVYLVQEELVSPEPLLRPPAVKNRNQRTILACDGCLVRCLFGLYYQLCHGPRHVHKLALLGLPQADPTTTVAVPVSSNEFASQARQGIVSQQDRRDIRVNSNKRILVITRNWPERDTSL